MPTRPSRRSRNKKQHNLSALDPAAPIKHPEVDDKDFSKLAYQYDHGFFTYQDDVAAHMDLPVRSDYDNIAYDEIQVRPTPYDEIRVGPTPVGVISGQTVSFQYRDREYEVEVPEGCGSGSYFHVYVESSFAWERKPTFDEDELGVSPSSSRQITCTGACDASCEDDPMWSTDWTMEHCLVASTHPIQSAEDSIDLNDSCCVEQQPDIIGFEKLLESPARNREEQYSKFIEVFDLSDVSTWLARLQHRREQAVRTGRTRLVRKIDREMDMEAEKSRRRGPIGPLAAFCNGTEGEEPVELDSVWCKDWSCLAGAGGA